MARRPLLLADVLLQGQSYAAFEGPGWDQDLEDALFAMRRLHKVPFHYLVPDPSALPPESIRFFHLNRAWIDRLIDGAISAALVGSGDQEEAAELARVARRALDARERTARNSYRFEPAPWRGGAQQATSRASLPEVSGMLIRSVVVRRWPGTEVRGFSRGGSSDRDDWTLVDKVRHERLSDSVMLVLWAGCPDFVEVEEPKAGVQYGVDVEGGSVSLQLRAADGSFASPPKEAPVRFRKGGRRVLGLSELRTELGDEGVRNSNAGLALQMQQTPFIQEFAGDGSPGFILMLPGLQVLNTHLASLAATLLEVEP